MPGLATLLCFVIGVTDGDTLTTRCGDQQLTIRLAEIDAPEAKQPFGRESRMNLRALCFQKEAVVLPQSADRYGRTVARVSCGGHDASSAQAAQGLAWAFTRYLRDPEIKRLEQGARDAGRGLWSQVVPPEPPWAYRARIRR